MIHWNGYPILLDASIPIDPEVSLALDKYRPAVESLRKHIIGYTKVYGSNDCRSSECNLGNFITDAIVYNRASQYFGSSWTDAAIAFVNGGSIRTSLPPGKITGYDLTTVLPFNNQLVAMNITGAVLKEILEQAILPKSEFLHWSGLRVEYNLSMPEGNRVKSTEVLCLDCDVPMYEPLDLHKEYGVITSTYLYNGTKVFSKLRVCSSTNTLLLFLTFLIVIFRILFVT